MTQLELLDSARHKLRLARYHADALVRALEEHPTEDLDDPRRIAMEAHLEGLAYTGTAAAEKTLRSIDPEAMSDQMPIQHMLRTVKADGRPDEERDFGRAFERWWFAQDQVAWFARELRNDAAHRVYEKAPDGPLWRMEIAGRTIALADFAERYSAHHGTRRAARRVGSSVRSLRDHRIVKLKPPDPPLADEAIRLVPMDDRHEAGIEMLLEDEDVRRHTRVPSEPPPGYAKTWLGRYEHGWRDGTRAGFAIESHDGEFLGLGMIVQVEWEGRQGEIG